MMLFTAVLLLVVSPVPTKTKVTRSTFGPCNFHCNMTIAGLGMYEANGPDMFEASSEQLSSFIHWYFWCVHIDRLIVL